MGKLITLIHQGPLLLTWLNFNAAWINNYMPGMVWFHDKSTTKQNKINPSLFFTERIVSAATVWPKVDVSHNWQQKYKTIFPIEI